MLDIFEISPVDDDDMRKFKKDLVSEILMLCISK